MNNLGIVASQISGHLGLPIEYLVIAGGSGGGGYGGGGGAAGGYQSGTLNFQTSTVTVGAGGAAVNAGSPINGSNSVMSTITSLGGGSPGNGFIGSASVGGSGGRRCIWRFQC